MEVLIIFDYPAKISAEVAVKKVVIIFRYGQPGLHILADANIYALYRYRCRWAENDNVALGCVRHIAIAAHLCANAAGQFGFQHGTIRQRRRQRGKNHHGRKYAAQYPLHVSFLFLGRPGTLSDRTRICQCYDCGLSPVFNGIHSFRIRQKIFCCTCSVLLTLNL